MSKIDFSELTLEIKINIHFFKLTFNIIHICIFWYPFVSILDISCQISKKII
uniref:Uncharacterized protein n=1 Tax=viral metagenome TaxID=1070528 RepID=A0A6C0LDZ3_9ZZZZ